MKRTFIVGTKLLGLLMIYWSSVYLPQFLLTIIHFLSRSEEVEVFGGGWLQGAALFLSFLLSLAIGLVAVFQTQGLAQWFGIEADEPLPIALSPAEILHIGMILIGVYVFVHAAPAAVGDILTVYSTGFSNGPMSYSHAHLVPSILQLAFAVMLIIRPTTVVRFILKHEGEQSSGVSSD